MNSSRRWGTQVDRYTGIRHFQFAARSGIALGEGAWMPRIFNHFRGPTGYLETTGSGDAQG
jgi:hypothetical protein